jgi:phospholipid/cholesterol/gamma-HCH transport system ATP-binding protein
VPTIRFENVTKSFGQDVVLRGISLQVRKAETKLLLGSNGSGKTTLLKMVPGLVKPTSGKVFVDEKEITRMTEDELREMRRNIGVVFQENALFDSNTVGENVAYRLLEDGLLSFQEIQATVLGILDFVGLKKAIDKMPAELSGGMKRRVSIARALVGAPKIMLYDEPTAGLDPITSRKICDLIIKLRDLEGVSSILVTHDLQSATTLCSEMALVESGGAVRFQPKDGSFHLANTNFVIIRDGSIIFEGNEEALGASEDPYLLEFLN